MPKRKQPQELPCILRDTREQDGYGWKWNKSALWSGTESRTLKTADYSIEGMEKDFFVIERKNSVVEWYQCLISGERAEDFANELVRLDAYKHPFIICEFPLSLINCFPLRSGLPKAVARRIKVTGQFLLRRTCEIQMKHRVKILFAGNPDCAKSVATSLMKRAIECRL